MFGHGQTEAVAIAKAVDASVESHDAFTIEESIVVRPKAGATISDKAKRKTQAENKKSRTARAQSRKAKKAKPRKKKGTMTGTFSSSLLMIRWLRSLSTC